MNISIIGVDGNMRTVEVSKAMEDHWRIPMNHAQTILDQINSGMYKKWFDGKKDLVCMDFGANVGLVSLYMSQFSKKTYCIEPTPSHYELAKELLFANCVEANVSLSDFALTSHDEIVTFATGHATENKVTIPSGYGSVKIEVQGKPLSYFIDKAMGIVDFCKIDIESGEMLALTVSELKKVHGRVNTFFVEVHPGYNGGMDGNREELVKRFTEAGYRVETEDYQTIVAYES